MSTRSATLISIDMPIQLSRLQITKALNVKLKKA